MCTKIRLYMTALTETLGPGKRFAIWVQGCNRHCKGCIAPDTWDLNGGYEVSVEELAKEILNAPGIEGITISGGEPFLQQEALCNLITKVQIEKDLGVIIYTGYKYQEIASSSLTLLSDLIIDGEYVDECNDDKSLRGSSNQNAICITDRYKDYVFHYFGANGRKIEFQLVDGSTQMIGIPSRNIEKMVKHETDTRFISSK